MKSNRVVHLLVLGGVLLLASAAMAWPTCASGNCLVRVSIQGSKQGAFAFDAQDYSAPSTPLSTTAHKGKSSGQPSGKRQWSPVTITKQVDGNTSKLMQAMQTKELLPSVNIELIENVNGRRRAHTIKLTNALVTAVRKERKGGKELETVTFTYENRETS